MDKRGPRRGSRDGWQVAGDEDSGRLRLAGYQGEAQVQGGVPGRPGRRYISDNSAGEDGEGLPRGHQDPPTDQLAARRVQGRAHRVPTLGARREDVPRQTVDVGVIRAPVAESHPAGAGAPSARLATPVRHRGVLRWCRATDVTRHATEGSTGRPQDARRGGSVGMAREESRRRDPDPQAAPARAAGPDGRRGREAARLRSHPGTGPSCGCSPRRERDPVSRGAPREEPGRDSPDRGGDSGGRRSQDHGHPEDAREPARRPDLAAPAGRHPRPLRGRVPNRFDTESYVFTSDRGPRSASRTSATGSFVRPPSGRDRQVHDVRPAAHGDLAVAHAGLSPWEVSRMVGHTTVAMIEQRYGHLYEHALQEKIDSLAESAPVS